MTLPLACLALLLAATCLLFVPIRERQPEPGISDAMWQQMLADARCERAFHGQPKSFEKEENNDRPLQN